ncbi:hypothetical protein A2115_00105 [Candidatus Woesebacteria bacterium GWA1_41_8]|jgi:hypothetical protein|uniref:DUF192 domain-containing protein n=1 Tax=Candidatus Woesebacteria bacterium GWA1_41_8 TaxID=1802471 RepID=A0A1F7WKD7_9BACT|nr:MAG: hypothetical protein A2115_00105 [Candidatus Woesebacteria bacterium GWA1_41_8]
MTRKFVYLIFIFLGIVAVIFLLRLPKNNPITQTTAQTQTYQMSVGKTNVQVEIADTTEKRAEGLSNRTSLKDDHGMLFVFNVPGTYPVFWMKDTLIPLDLIWIADSKIVQIDSDVAVAPPGTNDSDLPLYRPSVGIDYVLEVNAGFSQSHGLNVGDSVVLPNHY